MTRPPFRGARRCVAGFFAVVALVAAFRGDDPDASSAVSGAFSLASIPRGLPVATGDDHGIVILDDGSGDPAVLEIADARLGRGGTLAGALERLGLGPAKRHEISRALAKEIDPSRLPASTSLRASIDEQGRIRTVALRAEPGRFVRWTDDAEGPAVSAFELPVETRIEEGGGCVETSVRQALGELRWARELTLAFADIFQWDVDLLADVRAGDDVRLVYEKRVLGAVPADLPPFGDAASSEGDELGPGRVLAASYRGAVAEATAYWVDRPGGGGGYYDADGQPLRKTFLKSPLNYRRISSGFSNARRHPVTRKVVPHHGVDFAAARGTPVVAAADGRVISAGWQGALGRAVRIRHGSEYTTIYGHLQGVANGIAAGAEVEQNQVIGYVGSTGRATGPHLHYTLLHRGRPIDPMAFRNPPADPLAPDLVRLLEHVKLLHAPRLGLEPLVAGGSGVRFDSLRRGV